MDRFTLEEFAQKLISAYPEMDEYGLSDIELAREYFNQNPESAYLQQITNKDMLMPHSTEQVDEGIPIEPTDKGVIPDQTYVEAIEQKRSDAAWDAARQRLEVGGTDEAAGFWKQLGYNIQQHMTSMPGAVAGYGGWALEGLGADETGKDLVDWGEDMREWGLSYMDELVENDPELMALQIWQQDEPVDFNNFYQWDMLKRGMASAMPSLIEMAAMSYASGGLATLGYAAKGKKALDTARHMYKLGKGGIRTAQTAGGMTTGIVLEGSETWNTAMEYSKEQGMSNDEAAQVAGVATSIAAPIKGALEYFGFTQLAKNFGLKELGSRELSRILAGKTYQNMLARGGMKGLENATTEGITEWGQFMTDAFVQQHYKEGYGESVEEWMETGFRVLRDEGWSEGARESVYGGILMGGTTGTVGGAKRRLTPVETAARLKEVDEAAKKFAEDLKDNPAEADDLAKAANIQKALRYQYILDKATNRMDEDQKKKFLQEVDEIYQAEGIDQSLLEEEPVETSVADIKSTPLDVTINDYFGSIAKPRSKKFTSPKLAELNKVPEEDRNEAWEFLVDVAKSKGLPNKQQILVALKKKPSLINVLLKHENSAELLAIAVQGIRDAQGLPYAEYDLRKANPRQLENILRLFIQKGEIAPQQKEELAQEEFEIKLGTQEVPLDIDDAKVLLENQVLPEDADEAALINEQLKQFGAQTEGLDEKSIIDAMMSEEEIDYDAIADKYAVDEEVTEEKPDIAADLAAPATPDSWYWEMTKDEIEDKIKKDYNYLTDEDVVASAEMLSDKALIANSQFDDLTVPKLKAEIDKRNSDRGLKQGDEGYIPKTGRKQDLSDRLTQDDISQIDKQEVTEKATEEVVKETAPVDKEEISDEDAKKWMEDDTVEEKPSFSNSDLIPDDTTKPTLVERFKGFWKRKDVEKDTDRVYLFGDNTKDRTETHHIPTSTQAVIRGLANTIGIDTKKNRGTQKSSYLSDKDFDWFKNHVDEQIQKAKDTGKTIVISEGGIGTDKAQLEKRAPKLFAYLNEKLAELEGAPKVEKKPKKVSKKQIERNVKQVFDADVVDPTETTKSGVSVFKKIYSNLSKKYDEFASKIKETMSVKGMAKGEKLWNKYAAWYGDIDYTYTKKTHNMQDMPEEFQEIARDIEKKLGLEEGYFNSALANVYPEGEKLGKHADDEVIFQRDNETIGQVATISLGGAVNILISNNKTGKVESIRVEDGDMYVMPGDKFQLKHKHEVDNTEGARVSITFRHIPKARLEGKPLPLKKTTATNVSSNSRVKILAALTNPTVKSKNKGNIDNDYPVQYGTKQKEPYVDAEEAYQDHRTGDTFKDLEIMADIIKHKFEQHPSLYEGVKTMADRAGLSPKAWIESLSHEVGTKPSRWTGKGADSLFIQALSKGFTDANISIKEKTDKAIEDTGIPFGMDTSVLDDSYFGDEDTPVSTTAPVGQSDKPKSEKVDKVASESHGAVPVKTDVDNLRIKIKDGVEIQLNNDQQKAYDLMVNWVETGVGHFALLGYAGTGKTTLVQAVIDRIMENDDLDANNIRTAAPTHQAASVMRMFGSQGAGTLASLLGIGIKSDVSKYRKQFAPNEAALERSLKNVKYVIIDEVSMINNDLLELMLTEFKKRGIKAVLMGDPAQLPPVGIPYSPAFKAGTKFAHLVDDFQSTELEMVMRQKENNPLFKMYTELRYAIKNLTSLADSKEIPFNLEFDNHKGAWHYSYSEDGEGVAATNNENSFLAAVVKEFASEEYKKNPFWVRVITGTKAAREKWNKNVRGRLYGDKAAEQIIVGETFIPNVIKGEQGSIMLNSIPFQIVSKKEQIISFELDGRQVDIPCYSCEIAERDVETGELIKHREIHIIKGKHKNASREYISMLQELKAKYASAPLGRKEYYKNKAKEFEELYTTQFPIGVKNTSGRWINIDAEVDYGYASQVHKAQGSTYENVFVDNDSITQWGSGGVFAGYKDGKKPYEEMANNVLSMYQRGITEWDKRVHWSTRDRMFYTAFTRPKKKLIMFTQKPMGTKAQNLTPLDESTKPNPIEYQSKSLMQTWDSNKILSQAILDKLAKDFPEITAEALDIVLKENGEQALGRSLGYLVQWSKGKATMDTVPHEYAHVYLKMFAQDRIVKKGLSKFGEENMATYMGEYYANRMEGSLAKKFGMWLKQYWLMLKRRFAENKMTDANVQEYIASQFFSGARLGQVGVWTSNEWMYQAETVDTQDTPSEHSETWETMGRDPLDSHFRSMFMKSMDLRLRKSDYRDIIKIALETSTYEDFRNQVKDFINGAYPENAIIWDGRRNNINDTDLRIFWHKQGSKIHSWSKDNPTGRLNFEVIVNYDPISGGWFYRTKQEGKHYQGIDTEKDDEGKIIREGELRHLVSGNKVKLLHMTNFLEEGDSPYPTFQLSLKNFARENENQVTGKLWWEAFDGTIDKSFIQMMETKNPNRVYIGSKGGDHSAIYWSKVPDDMQDMTKKEFVDYIKKEFEDDNITEADMTTMVKEAMQLEAMYRGANVNAFAKIVTRHEWWKTHTYPQYMMGTHQGSDTNTHKSMGVQDHYDRLRIAGSDGYTVRDFGKSSIMTVSAESMVLDENGNEVQQISEYDGWLLSSGRWFKKLSKSLGKQERDNVTAVKGVLFNRNYNPDGTVNFIATKSMQMRPYRGMQIQSPEGNIVAKYVGVGTNGRWQDAEGNNFDHLSPTDTSKMTSGKYAEFNVAHELEEGYQKITHNVSEKDKIAFPVTQAELSMDLELLGTPEGRHWMEKINEYYDGVINDYVVGLESFLNNPAELYKELKKHKDDNELLTELDKYIDLVGEDGIGLLHPVIKKMWLMALGNKYIKHGLYKLKSREKGLGTMMYYKPYYAPAFQNRKLGKNDFVSSSDNRVIVNLVEREYKQQVYNDPERNIGWQDEHDRISTLNAWLDEKYDNGAYKNNIPVLLSRQPIVKITGVVMRNVRHLKEGQHSQTMFLSHHDVLNVFDGDWDGDKGMLQIIEDKSVVKAYTDWQKSDEFKKKERAVKLPVFGKKIGGTSMGNMQDMATTLNNINLGMNQIGLITNARNAYFSMHTKGMELEMQNGRIATTFSPQDVIVMDYLPIDKEALIQDNTLFQEMEAQGDAFVMKVDGKWKKVSYDNLSQIDPAIDVYLQTTKEHEFANLLQMAVDDSKWGLLSEVIKGSKLDMRKLVVSLMFKDSVGNRIKSKDTLMWLAAIKKGFNFSSQRQGKFYDAMGDKKIMKLEDFLSQSRNIQMYKEKDYMEEGFFTATWNMVSARYADEKQWAKIEKPESITYKWTKKTETPQEKILSSLARFNPNNPASSKIAQLDENTKMSFVDNADKSAHRHIIIGMNRQWEKIIADKNMNISQEDIDIAVNFAENIALEYHPLFEGVNSRGIVFEKEISIDYSEDVELIVDKYSEIWQNMTDAQKMLSTVYYLMGTRTTGIAASAVGKRAKQKREMVKNFIPLDLMHPEVLKRYLKDWHIMVMSENLVDKSLWKKDKFEKELKKGFDFNQTKAVSVNTLRKMCE